MSYNYKPLFIIKNFSLDTNPGGIQSRRFVKALLKEGIKPEIFCLNTKNQNQKLLQEEIKIHYVNEMPHKYFFSIMRRLFPDILYLPDIQRFTFLPFLKKKLNSLSLNEFDWIHTVSFSCSSHLAGLYLKSKTNLPWVAQFYDPWVGNCYRKYKTNFFRKLDEKIEYQVAINADLIIHTNEIIKKDWERRYGEIVKNKIFVLPFSYDVKSPVMNDAKPKNKKKKRILYAGNLYLDRNLEDIIKTLKILKTKVPDLEEKIEFVFIGNVPSSDKISVTANNLNNLFVFLGQKPYKELSEYYNNADLLLVIDAPAKENLFFPSKLIEYFLYQKPILGISPTISATHDLLSESGHTWIENGDISKMVEYFMTLLNNYDAFLKFDHHYYQKFSPEQLGSEYLKLVETFILK